MAGKSSQELRFLMLLSQDSGTMLHHYLSHFVMHHQLPLITCYLLGGYTKGAIASIKVFSVCLNDLISQAVSQPASASAPPTSSPLQSLPDTPMTSSTALAFNGALLAVGGRTAIYHYQPSSRSWIRAGELPTERFQCTCVVLPSGDLYVAGGASAEQRVDIVSVQ